MSVRKLAVCVGCGELREDVLPLEMGCKLGTIAVCEECFPRFANLQSIAVRVWDLGARLNVAIQNEKIC